MKKIVFRQQNIRGGAFINPRWGLVYCSLRRPQRPRESSISVGETGQVTDQSVGGFLFQRLNKQPESSQRGCGCFVQRWKLTSKTMTDERACNDIILRMFTSTWGTNPQYPFKVEIHVRNIFASFGCGQTGSTLTGPLQKKMFLTDWGKGTPWHFWEYEG